MGRTGVLVILLCKQTPDLRTLLHQQIKHLFHYPSHQLKVDGEWCQINGNSKVAKSPQSWTELRCGVWPEASKPASVLDFYIGRQRRPPCIRDISIWLLRLSSCFSCMKNNYVSALACVDILHETFNQILHIAGASEIIWFLLKKARQILFQLKFWSHRTLHNQKNERGPHNSKNLIQ